MLVLIVKMVLGFGVAVKIIFVVMVRTFDNPGQEKGPENQQCYYFSFDIHHVSDQFFTATSKVIELSFY
ncbi:hypothetical protein DDZ16_17790 [Marinilabilia rubra]|uniref:Uncharacterized protein n=1 Tax=Marinilabilia rubra TaxID=2162893 RepID=A0A2U2B4R4_9BACT|nr:hypothetical protein DDZ16_17790 [Marinilabilia rubra]